MDTVHKGNHNREVQFFQGTVPGSIYSTSKSTEISGATSSSGQRDSPVLNTKAVAVRAHCGDTSPWVSLVNHVDSKAEPDPQLQKTASRLAEDERSSNFSISAIPYDLL
jgi:hypothetical protein